MVFEGAAQRTTDTRSHHTRARNPPPLSSSIPSFRSSTSTQVRWRECDGYMGCNAVEDFVLAPGQSNYLIDSIVVTERPDWTVCCKECTIDATCKSWVLLLDGEEGICDLYLIESPALRSLNYSISSTRASFFGTRGYSDEPLGVRDCIRDTIVDAAWPDDDASTASTYIPGMCAWYKMWYVR